MTHRIFVYGTLRKGATPTHRLPGYLMFKVRGKHFDFPFIQPYPYHDTQPDVYGNIIEVDDEGLEELDKYENVAMKLYRRVDALAYPVGQAVADSVPVQVYVGGPALAYAPIPSGLWEQRG